MSFLARMVERVLGGGRGAVQPVVRSRFEPDAEAPPGGPFEAIEAGPPVEEQPIRRAGPAAIPPGRTPSEPTAPKPLPFVPQRPLLDRPRDEVRVVDTHPRGDGKPPEPRPIAPVERKVGRDDDAGGRAADAERPARPEGVRAVPPIDRAPRGDRPSIESDGDLVDSRRPTAGPIHRDVALRSERNPVRDIAPERTGPTLVRAPDERASVQAEPLHWASRIPPVAAARPDGDGAIAREASESRVTDGTRPGVRIPRRLAPSVEEPRRHVPSDEVPPDAPASPRAARALSTRISLSDRSPPAQPKPTASDRPGELAEARRPVEAPPAAPTIRVHIGRIEIRAIAPASEPAARSVPVPPRISLDDYLRGQR